MLSNSLPGVTALTSDRSGGVLAYAEFVSGFGCLTVGDCPGGVGQLQATLTPATAVLSKWDSVACLYMSAIS